MQQDPAIPQSDYQRGLDEDVPKPEDLSTDTVRYWSDFNRVFYHPRSIVQINDYELGSSLMPFEKWESGEELFTTMDRDEDLLDRDFRPWAEECDQLQGIQILTGADDAWGGFASSYGERIRDEFGKTSIWVWGVEEQHGRGQRVLYPTGEDGTELTSVRRLRNCFGPSTLRRPSTPCPCMLPCMCPCPYLRQTSQNMFALIMIHDGRLQLCYQPRRRQCRFLQD